MAANVCDVSTEENLCLGATALIYLPQGGGHTACGG